MDTKTTTIDMLEKALAREREKHARTQRLLDCVVAERNELDRLYTNLTFDFSDLAKAKIHNFFKYSKNYTHR